MLADCVLLTTWITMRGSWRYWPSSDHLWCRELFGVLSQSIEGVFARFIFQVFTQHWSSMINVCNSWKYTSTNYLVGYILQWKQQPPMAVGVLQVFHDLSEDVYSGAIISVHTANIPIIGNGDPSLPLNYILYICWAFIANLSFVRARVGRFCSFLRGVSSFSVPGQI